MRTVEKKVFVTDDGKEFLNHEDAEKHELNIRNTRHFRVRHAPDRTETGRFTKVMLAAVHTDMGCHRHILLQYLMKDLGWNAVGEGVMGYGHMSEFIIEDISTDEYLTEKAEERILLSQICINCYPKNINFAERWGLTK